MTDLFGDRTALPFQSLTTILTMRALFSSVLLAALCGLPANALSPQDGTPRARRVQVAAVEITDLQDTLQLVASVAPWQSAILIPRESGILAELTVEVGDTVKRGQVIATLAAPELNAQLEVLRAMVAQAQANAAEVSARLPQAEAQVLVARNERDASNVELETRVVEGSIAERVFTRVSALHGVGAATDEEFENAEAMRTRAQSAIRIAEAQFSVAATRIRAAEAAVTAEQAALKGAQAMVTSAERKVAAHEVRLSFLSLTCPYEQARVTERYVDPGALLMGGASEVVKLVDLSKARLQLNIPESAAGDVKPGSTLDVRFDAYPGVMTAMTVTRTAGVMDPSSRTMRAEVELENADGKYLPGMFAHANLILRSAPAAKVVPGGAIYRGEDGATFVLIANAGLVERTVVVLGLDDGKRVEILSGLQADSLVVLGRPPGLGTGDAIDYARPRTAQ